MGKICYLHSQRDVAFLHLTADNKKQLHPSHLRGYLQRVRHTQVFFTIHLFCPHHIQNNAFNACLKLISPICIEACNEVLFRQDLYHTLLLKLFLKLVLSIRD